MANTTLKVTSAFMLRGKMRVRDDIVPGVDARTARDLIRRGKAQEATSDVAAEFAQHEDESAADQAAKGSAKKGGAGAAKPKAGATGAT